MARICSVQGCDQKHYALGWCKTHYARLRSVETCSIPGCDDPILARGWCCCHYNRWTAHGDPLAEVERHARPGEPLAWLHSHVGYCGDSCLIWPFARTGKGYANLGGQAAINIMCELAHGRAPTSKHEAAHSCGRGRDGCISPVHLRWATRKENHADKKLHGTNCEGESNYRAILTEADVIAIRSLAGRKSQTQIALQFGVSKGCVTGVIYRKNWRHIP
jgi:hypothetical protein